MDQESDIVPRRSRWVPSPSYSAEDRLRRLIEASPTALLVVGQNGLIEIANTRAEAMFGYAHGALPQEPVEILLPERLRDRHKGLRAAFTRNVTSRQMGAALDLYGRRRDGTEFPLEIGLNPLDLDGVPTVLVGIVDLTERRRAEAEIRQHHLDLERSNADLEEFAYVASHDLKAPLRAIGHLAEWIAEDVAATASEETRENLGLLKGRVARLQVLLEGLLAYARIGRARRAPEDVDVGEMVEDIAALLGPPGGFSVVFEGPETRLRAHPMALRLVLENLIGNALKHHDRAQGRVAIAMRRADGLVEFTVADDGPGIAPRYHERIFQIFQTLARRDDREASGIGLAIVKKQVGQHGGSVHVESAPPERGTKFVFTWQELA